MPVTTNERIEQAIEAIDTVGGPISFGGGVDDGSLYWVVDRDRLRQILSALVADGVDETGINQGPREISAIKSTTSRRRRAAGDP